MLASEMRGLENLKRTLLKILEEGAGLWKIDFLSKAEVLQLVTGRYQATAAVQLALHQGVAIVLAHLRAPQKPTCLTCDRKLTAATLEYILVVRAATAEPHTVLANGLCSRCGGASDDKLKARVAAFYQKNLFANTREIDPASIGYRPGNA